MSEKKRERILIIEDEDDIALLMQCELEAENYEVEVAADGIKGLVAARRIQPDLIILDRMLPELDGMEICKRLRQSSDVPIIMVTAKGDFDDRVDGLDAGANDYIPKPFNLNEFLARVRAQLRMRNPTVRTQFEFGPVLLDTQTREVLCAEHPIQLSPKEYELLLFFMQHPRQVLTRQRILEVVWGWDFDGEDNVLDVYMHTLRDKLEKADSQRYLQTVRGVGYMLKEP
jgi:DNA-binding response OmpR family regulator